MKLSVSHVMRSALTLIILLFSIAAAPPPISLIPAKTPTEQLLQNLGAFHVLRTVPSPV
jgi:hypothetical protein